MTDPITCPECGGRKVQRFGRLALRCRFCHGRGWVGAEHEPAEPRPGPPPPPPAAWEHKVWREEQVREALACHYCLDAGSVTRVDRQARTLVSAPCPACQPGAAPPQS
ncbi:hypothetical protein [Streptosporangium sp. KLBMP 9127]|nr:hypothetical protein [Streptosporangium sp. KLBMP 9127]